MSREIRCGAKKHGELVETFLEVKCSSRFCGAKPDIIVLHRFDLETGELVGTKRYKEIGASHGA